MPNPVHPKRHSKFSNLNFSPCSRLSSSYSEVSIHPLKVKRGEHRTLNHTMWSPWSGCCVWRRVALCPNAKRMSWQLVVHDKQAEWKLTRRNIEKFIQFRRTESSSRNHSIISAGDSIFSSPSKGKSKPRRNQICPVPDESEIDWLKRLRQNTFLAGESVYKTINFQLFSLSLGSVVF